MNTLCLILIFFFFISKENGGIYWACYCKTFFILSTKKNCFNRKITKIVCRQTLTWKILKVAVYIVCGFMDTA